MSMSGREKREQLLAMAEEVKAKYVEEGKLTRPEMDFIQGVMARSVKVGGVGAVSSGVGGYFLLRRGLPHVGRPARLFGSLGFAMLGGFVGYGAGVMGSAAELDSLDPAKVEALEDMTHEIAQRVLQLREQEKGQTSQ